MRLFLAAMPLLLVTWAVRNGPVALGLGTQKMAGADLVDVFWGRRGGS